MAQFTSGTVSVTNGSPTVTYDSSPAPDLSSISAGDIFIITGETAYYVIASVDNSAKTLTLTGNYAGSASPSTGLSYSVTTSFTPNYSIPYPEKGDIETATIVKDGFLTIDNILNGDGSSYINAASIGTGVVSNTEFNKLNGISGDIVGTTDTQTLTNKTITTISADTTSTKLGSSALGSIDTGSSRYATAYGDQACAAVTTGTFNTGIGHDALKTASTSGNNTAVGANALTLTTGSHNTAIGSLALPAVSSGNGNVAAGYNAGENISTGSYNVALGYEALSNGTSSTRIVAIGYRPMLGAGNVTDCIAIGYDAMRQVSGNTNIGIGNQIFDALTSGTTNTAVGTNAAATLATGSNNTLLGNGADTTTSSVSNEITLGNSSVATLRCQVTTITALSDERDKKNINDLDMGLDFINGLRPVKFDWNTRDGKKIDISDTGFIAQDLQRIQTIYGELPGLVYDENPEKLEAGYGKLIPVLVKAIQDLSNDIDCIKNNL